MGEKPALFLYNTLSRNKEPFKPADGETARIYSCGLTVYSAATIGNMRTYIFMDSLRRVLKRNGYKLRHVMNITDVGHLVSDEDTGEDKMLKGARERNKTPWEVAREFTELFMDDAASLNIGMPEIISKATDHIPQMLEMVEKLVDDGYGYEISDGIYFDIGKFAGYGQLSRIDLDGQLAGARVDVNREKRNPADFALWKKAPKEHIMKWDSRWGDGYPGWHIECSAMSIHYLGDSIDIHSGGTDHIPIHHENEIAQSDAYAGKRVVNIWMHAAFLLIDNGKMSKSLGNLFTVGDLRARGFNPLVYRYFCLNAHYRNKLNFTWDGMRAAAVSYRRFIEGALAHRDAGNGFGGAREAGAGTGAEAGGVRALIADTVSSFDAALNDDLNVPKALGIAWQLIRSPVKSAEIYDALLEMDEIFGLGLKEAGAAAKNKADSDESLKSTAFQTAGIPADILELVKEREAARAAKDWKKSDELRDAIKAGGFAVMDSKQGVTIERI